MLPDNVFDTVGLSLGLDENDPDFSMKQELLKTHGLEDSTETQISLDGEPAPKFIEAMRIRELRVCTPELLQRKAAPEVYLPAPPASLLMSVEELQCDT